MEKFTVIRQNWIESERGWGIRPDGYSLHLNDEQRAQFVKAYWDSKPNETPDEYSRPDGAPERIEVDASIYEAVKASPPGVRRFH